MGESGIPGQKRAKTGRSDAFRNGENTANPGPDWCFSPHGRSEKITGRARLSMICRIRKKGISREGYTGGWDAPRLSAQTGLNRPVFLKGKAPSTQSEPVSAESEKPGQKWAKAGRSGVSRNGENTASSGPDWCFWNSPLSWRDHTRKKRDYFRAAGRVPPGTGPMTGAPSLRISTMRSL